MNIIKNKDIWDDFFKYDLVCITTNAVFKKNNTLVMGAGIAKEAATRFPMLPTIFYDRINKYGNVPCLAIKVKNTCISSFPTKHHFKDKSDINLIENSAIKLKEMADKFQFKKIALTPPGCGCGKLNWEQDVKPVLENIFDERFYIYFK